MWAPKDKGTNNVKPLKFSVFPSCYCAGGTETPTKNANDIFQL